MVTFNDEGNYLLIESFDTCQGTIGFKLSYVSSEHSSANFPIAVVGSAVLDAL